MDTGDCSFQPDVAEQILKIPLAETEQEDLQVWRGEPTGEFSVRSAYKLLHGSNLDPNDLLLQTETKTFYNKLWKLHIPTKIQMTIWRISWDFIPSFVNLKIKRVVMNTLCPRCGCAEENSWHIFIQYPGFLIEVMKSSFNFSVVAFSSSGLVEIILHSSDNLQ